jgi:predicted lactoylglutathione lyase
MPASTHLTCITLGVRDVADATRFYKALGFKPASVLKEVAFLQLQGSVLSLFGKRALAEDAGLPSTWGKPGGLSLAVNLKSKKAVDAFYAKALKAGAKAQKKPHDAFWGGYSGYFKDPDGHLWELAWNPFWKLDARGRVSVPTR